MMIEKSIDFNKMIAKNGSAGVVDHSMKRHILSLNFFAKNK